VGSNVEVLHFSSDDKVGRDPVTELQKQDVVLLGEPSGLCWWGGGGILSLFFIDSDTRTRTGGLDACNGSKHKRCGLPSLVIVKCSGMITKL